tara:strand:+ start:2607 stop:3626 length:1020 start_codon:yes stop_codon:yes gene_type:complete
MKKRSLVIGLLLGLTITAQADNLRESSHTHNYEILSHAPIGVMKDHTHSEGEWMVSYRFMTMDMGALYQGSTKRSIAEVTSQYMMSPQNMEMNMHMFGAMYAPSSSWTLMAMLPYRELSMTMINRMGAQSDMSALGIGDISLTALYGPSLSEKETFLAHIGLSLPTGAIDRSQQNSMGMSQRLPYSMQLGSGSTDFLGGATYTQQFGDIQLGTQADITYRSARNPQGYRLGHKASLTAWTSKAWTPSLSSSLRLAYRKQGGISGEDAFISSQTMSPSTNTANSGYSSFDLGVGIAFLGQEGPLKGHRLAFEYTFPISTHTNGIQLANSGVFTFGWQKSY